MRIAVVGAAGTMAQVVMRDLLEMGGVEAITALDRRPVAYVDPRVRAAECDVRDVEATSKLLAGHDALLNCATYYFNLPVMRAALAAHVPYSDLGGLYHGTVQQFGLDSDFRAAGLPALLGMGSSPGITNAMAGRLAKGLDRVDEIQVRVGCLDKNATGTLPVPYALDTVLDEFSLPPMLLEEGEARQLEPMSGRESIDFPPPVGRMEAMYTLHSEVAMFARSFPRLRRASFKVAFAPALVEKFGFLVELGFAERKSKLRGVSPRQMLLALAAERPAAAALVDDADALRVVVRGQRDGRAVELRGDCVVLPDRARGIAAGTLDTGVPLAIAGALLARGEIAGSGVLCPEVVLPFDSFFVELARRGIEVQFEEEGG